MKARIDEDGRRILLGDNITRSGHTAADQVIFLESAFQFDFLVYKYVYSNIHTLFRLAPDFPENSLGLSVYVRG